MKCGQTNAVRLRYRVAPGRLRGEEAYTLAVGGSHPKTIYRA